MNKVFDEDWFRENDSYSFEMLKNIIEAMDANVFFKDINSVYRMVSYSEDKIRKTSDLSSSVGITDFDLMADPAIAKVYYDDDRKIIATKTGSVLSNIIPKDEKNFYYSIVKSPVFNAQHEVIGIFGVVIDRTENTVLKEKLRQSSITDPLTKVYNRGYLEEYLTDCITEESFPLSFILSDCNGLKVVNDTIGHKYGDQLLMETVSLFKKCIPEHAVIFRLGGDEFMIACPNMTDKESRMLIRRFEKAESEKTEGIPLQSAYGHATLKEKIQEFTEIIGEMDKSMYRDKQKKKSAYLDHLHNLLLKTDRFT